MKIIFRHVSINVGITILIKNININNFAYQHRLKQEGIVFNILAGIVIVIVYLVMALIIMIVRPVILEPSCLMVIVEQDADGVIMIQPQILVLVNVHQNRFIMDHIATILVHQENINIIFIVMIVSLMEYHVSNNLMDHSVVLHVIKHVRLVPLHYLLIAHIVNGDITF